jgi:hypothetical protein
MPIAKLKGVNGGSVLVQTDNIGYVDGRNTEQGPILGQSVVVLMNGNGVFVQGTPDQIYGVLRHAEGQSAVEISQ